MRFIIFWPFKHFKKLQQKLNKNIKIKVIIIINDIENQFLKNLMYVITHLQF